MAKVYEGRKSGAMKGATAGATTGAVVGSAFPGIGTAIGAGAGALVGGAIGFGAGGPTEYERLRQEELDEMLRREQLGMLGLTDEERRVLESQMVDPLRAQQREAEARRLGAMGIGDIGGGAYFKAAGADQARGYAEEAAMRHKIAQADIREKNREEAILADDLKEQAAIDEAKRAEARAAAEQEFNNAFSAYQEAYDINLEEAYGQEKAAQYYTSTS